MLNKCCFIGNLGADPECKTMGNGNPVVNLSLAVTETWRCKQSGEKKSRTEWVRIVIFNEALCKLAQNYLRKGSKVYVEGKMQTRKWTDQSGTDKYTTEICLQQHGAVLTMLGGDNQQSQNNQQNDYSGGSQYDGGFDDDQTIPF